MNNNYSKKLLQNKTNINKYRFLNRGVRGSRPIIFFGGSFDPPHKGHINAALMASISLNERVHWKVCVQNRNKEPHFFSESKRLDMVKQITSEINNRFIVSKDSLSIKGSLYALSRISLSLKNNRIILLIGGDCWSNFSEWKRWKDLLKRYPIFIANRPGYLVSSSRRPAAISFKYKRRKKASLLKKGGAGWYYAKVGPDSSLSSSRLRDTII